MPNCKTLVINDSTTVKVWHILENEHELKESLLLSQASFKRLRLMKSEIHRKGFLAVRQLLKTFDYDDCDLYYNANGKPFLKDGKFISISHSFQYAVVVVSDASVGIDIEKLRPKISRLTSKFIGTESLFLNNDLSCEIDRLTAIWTSKEALYKFYDKPGLSLHSSCIVLPFFDLLSDGVCWIVKQNENIKCYSRRFRIDDFILTLVIAHE